MREMKFALGYMPHRLWGNILQAQFLEKEPGKEFFLPREYIQNDETTSAWSRLTPMQREVIRLIDSYSERSLHGLFSRHRTAKEFQDSVDRKTIDEIIRPYIEKQIFQILEIARDNRISVFVKDKSDRNVYPEDFVGIEKHPADPVFDFRYNTHLSYTLQLIHGDSRLLLHKGYVEIISYNPTSIILGNTIYFINDIDGKKLKPFLNKEEVIISGEMIGKYFSTFVRNTLRDYKTLSEGFEVLHTVPATSAELILEEGMKNMPVFILNFYYNGQHIYPDSSLPRFVDYKGKGEEHRFEIYPRDPAWEDSISGILNEQGLNTRDQRSFFLSKRFLGEQENNLFAAINFLNISGKALLDQGISFRQRLQHNYYLGTIDLKMDSKEKEDWFDILATVAFGEYNIPFLSLRNHILNGIREYELPGGEIAIIPAEWFARYRNMFEFGKPEGDRILVHKQHFGMVDGPIRDFHPETLERLEQLTQLERLPAVDLPGGLTTELRGYQEEGYRWLLYLRKNGFGGCLADDMGLGKTVQAIALLLRSKQETSLFQPERKEDKSMVNSKDGQLTMFGTDQKKLTSMIVVPASLIHNWKSECNRFAPDLKLYLHVGNQRNRELSNFSYYDLILSTYHTVRQDIEQLSTYPFHYVILDESQMIKNPSSKLYQAMIDLQSEHRIVLTGTPIENSLTDLWSQINFVNPGLLGTLSFFKRSFVMPIEKKKDEQREEKLKDLINPFILRRTKQEVATELPPVFEQVRYCNMTDSQRRLYEEEKSLARNSILENLEEMGLEKSSLIVLQALTRLRQIANHPNLIDEFTGYDSGKFSEVCRDVESVLAEGHKVLVFSSFVKHLELFRARFNELSLKYALLTGASTGKQREKAVNTFQKDNQCRLFLISLKAGGVGLNLTAADYVFILDPWWNPAAEMQALNRAHRIGQEKNVFIYRFISSNTIEEKIQKLQEKKKELAETFVTSNNPLSGLSEKDLVELFQ